MHSGTLCITAVLAIASTGCLTTPASETGWTRRARDARPKACGQSAVIEDMEDADSRVLVREGRGGYWFTSVDNEGSIFTSPSGQFKMGEPGRGHPLAPGEGRRGQEQGSGQWRRF